jgi:predicted ATPase
VDYSNPSHNTNSLLCKVQEKKMNNKTEVVIVTGSSGMISSTLIATLADKYHVDGFDQDGYPFPSA